MLSLLQQQLMGRVKKDDTCYLHLELIELNGTLTAKDKKDQAGNDKQ